MAGPMLGLAGSIIFIYGIRSGQKTDEYSR